MLTLLHERTAILLPLLQNLRDCAKSEVVEIFEGVPVSFAIVGAEMLETQVGDLTKGSLWPQAEAVEGHLVVDVFGERSALQ